MSTTKKTNNLEAFLSSRTGRKFFNILYSVGASVVIIGALAKIIHLPMGNELLVIGMVTEAFVFFISAFDNAQVDYVDEPQASGMTVVGGAGVAGATPSIGAAAKGSGAVGGGGVIIAGGGGFVGGGSGVTASAGATRVSSTGTVVSGGAASGGGSLSPEYMEKMEGATKGMEDFSGVMSSLNDVSQDILDSYKKISDSAQSVSTNVVNINEVYEAQMKAFGEQIGTMKYINDSLDKIKTLYDHSVMDSHAFKMENERMTRQIQELNQVYSRLLQAMNAGGGGYNPGGGGYNNPNQNPSGGYNNPQGGEGYNPSR